jgi:hypothetical protein
MEDPKIQMLNNAFKADENGSRNTDVAPVIMLDVNSDLNQKGMVKGNVEGDQSELMITQSVNHSGQSSRGELYIEGILHSQESGTRVQANANMEEILKGNEVRGANSGFESVNTGNYMRGDGWQTPNQVLEEYSDCLIIANKFLSLINEESHHSKWEEFRRMAREGVSKECSILLKRMELED